MQIPGANGLGQQIARAQPLNETQIPRGAFGATVAASVGQVANALQRDEAVAANEKQRAIAIRDHEERQAIAHRQAADRAKAVATVTQTHDELIDQAERFAEGVAAGTIDKTKAGAEWKTLAEDRATKALESVAPEMRDAVQADLMHKGARLSRAVGKAVLHRDQQDTGAAIGQTLEYAQRLYATDQKAATRLVDETLTQLGPFAGMAPDAIAKARQGFNEGAQYTQAFSAITANRNNYKGLGEAEALIASLPDLDPQKKAALLDRSAGMKLHLEQRAEIAAQRAARQAEAAAKRAEHEFTAATALADKGVLSGPYAEAISGKLAGTPYQAAFRALIEQQRAVGATASMPIASQRRALDELNSSIAKDGLTPERDKQRERLEKIVRGAEADLKADPLRAGLERGVITEIAPLDVSNPQTIVATLGARLEQSRAVSAWAGKAVTPFTEQEAGSVKGMLDTLPVKERSQAVATLAKALGPQAAAGFARQMDEKDRALALAFGAGSTGTDRGRLVSELLLRGQQAKKDGTSTKGEKAPAIKAAAWEARISTMLEGVYPSAKLTADMREAALLVAHGMASEEGGAMDDKLLTNAARMVANADFVQHQGRRTAIPVGWSSSDMQRTVMAKAPDVLKAMAKDGKVLAGGALVDAAEFSKVVGGQQLQRVANGRYAVIVGGRPVTNTQGEPIVIGVQ